MVNKLGRPVGPFSREEREGYREGRKAGYADALLGRIFEVSTHVSPASVAYTRAYCDGYRDGQWLRRGE